MSLATNISLAHGNGGQHSHALIEHLRFLLANHTPLHDAVMLPTEHEQLFMTCDSFTVTPLHFPGGDIGSLAVHGIVNDLAVAGARPAYASLALILEEGMAMSELDSIITSLANAARAAKLVILCGDTKVVPRGQAHGMFISMTGIGIRQTECNYDMDNIQAGDHIIVSGPIGDHGATILLARETTGLSGDLESDSANIQPLCESVADLPGVIFMRDPTRGGLATVLHEIHQHTDLGINLEETQIPVRPQVAAVCEILGLDPLYLACEGRVVAVVRPEISATVLARWQQHPLGHAAKHIGHLTEPPQAVVIHTALGGQRLLPPLLDTPLPRIC